MQKQLQYDESIVIPSASSQAKICKAGTVSSNPQDIFLGGMILFSGYNAGRYGLDHWGIPYMREVLFKLKDNRVSQNSY